VSGQLSRWGPQLIIISGHTSSKGRYEPTWQAWLVILPSVSPDYGLMANEPSLNCAHGDMDELDINHIPENIIAGAAAYSLVPYPI